MNEFIVKEDAGFKLSVKMWKCLTPADLNSIEIISDDKNEDGTVSSTSTSRFFMTPTELSTFVKGLSRELA
jgi:hypothetical protein